MSTKLEKGDRVKVTGLVGGDAIGHVLRLDTFSTFNRATGRHGRNTQYEVRLESGLTLWLERARIRKARMRKA